jgi:hypothetical protein
MVERIFGVGLVPAISLAFFTMFLIILTKTVVNKHPIEGLTEVVNTI